MKTIAIFNMKGGAAKSVTSYNLAVGLTRFHSKRVLLVDIDPQGHSSAFLGIPSWDLQQTIADALMRRTPLRDVLCDTPSGVTVAPANLLLAGEEIPISGLPGRELLLRKSLSSVEGSFDIALIDCPPNIGVFSVNALMAAQHLLVPVDMGYPALLGVRSLERALTMIREELDHPIGLRAVLATRYDGRTNLHKDIHQSLLERFGDKLCSTIIPESIRINEATSAHLAIFDYEPKGPGAQAYRQVVDEVASW